MDNTLNRLTRIVSRSARRLGVSAAVYASGTSFNVLAERKDTAKVKGGIYWVRRDMADAYRVPRVTAQSIRRELKKVWAA